jgi:hypothetical protein
MGENADPALTGSHAGQPKQRALVAMKRGLHFRMLALAAIALATILLVTENLAGTAVDAQTGVQGYVFWARSTAG